MIVQMIAIQDSASISKHWEHCFCYTVGARMATHNFVSGHGYGVRTYVYRYHSNYF